MIYRSYRRTGLNPILVIIGINVILFIATLISRDLILLLGLQPASFLDRPWTIITSMFMHGGFGHIFANMFTLFFFGSSLFQLIGNRRFLLVYLGGGILGNIFYLFLGHPFIPAVGASGAIFALGGVLTVLRPKLRVFVFPIPLPIPLWAAVIGGFLILSLFPYVAWQAHLGGLIFGLIAGFLFRKRERYSF